MSGNIGAAEVQRLSAAVEKAIRDRAARTEIDPLVDRLAAAESDLIASLRQGLPASETGGPAGQADPEQAASACRKLAELLDQYDGEAVTFLSGARDLFRNSLGTTAFEAIQKAANDFEFDNARNLLQQSVKALSVGR